MSFTLKANHEDVHHDGDCFESNSPASKQSFGDMQSQAELGTEVLAGDSHKLTRGGHGWLL